MLRPLNITLYQSNLLFSIYNWNATEKEMLDHNIFCVPERHFLQQCIPQHWEPSLCPAHPPGTAHVPITWPGGSAPQSSPFSGSDVHNMASAMAWGFTSPGIKPNNSPPPISVPRDCPSLPTPAHQPQLLFPFPSNPRWASHRIYLALQTFKAVHKRKNLLFFPPVKASASW